MRVALAPALASLAQPAVDRLVDAQVAGRIARKDNELWGPAVASEAAIRLGWVTSARDSVELIAEILELRDQLRSRGINRIVLCGMGGSSLAPEVIARQSDLELVILDATSPDQVASAIRDLERTAVVVSSKSGSTVETDSQKRAFEAAFTAAGLAVSEHMIIVTDPGSPLDQAARADGYRVFNADSNVGGRYSALTAFGLVPAGLAGADIAGLLSSAQQVASVLSTNSPENPALILAAALAAVPKPHDAGHRDKFLVETDQLPGFADWVEQLVAESTGKEGRGSLPIAIDGDAPELSLDLADTLVVRYAGSSAVALPAPVAENLILFTGDLGELFLMWEFATAAMGWLLEINPFDQPNVESAKTAARALLDAPSQPHIPDFVDGGIAVTAQALSTPPGSLDAAIEALLAAVGPLGYLSIHTYLSRVELPQFADLRGIAANRLARPVSFGWGPRFLHSTGQYHKGGPAQGAFLQLTVRSEFDHPVPGRPFSFGTLLKAQAAGDARVLADQGLPVLTLELSDPLADLARIGRLVRDR